MRMLLSSCLSVFLVACSSGDDHASKNTGTKAGDSTRDRDESAEKNAAGHAAETKDDAPAAGDDESKSDAGDKHDRDDDESTPDQPAPDAGHTNGAHAGASARPPKSTSQAGGAGPEEASGDDSDAGTDPDDSPSTNQFPDVHFSMDVHVPAGAELLKCKYVAMPTDRGVLAVPSAESHYTPGSHHFLIYRSNLVGVPADHADVFDCPDDDWGHNRGSYYEAQQPDSSRSLPPGVAQLFQPNEVIILQSHYINANESDLDAHAELILHTMDPAKVEHEAGSILFSNPNIFLPPHSRTRITMTCPLPQDFNPAELWSHMHHRSSNFIATTDDADAMAALGGALYMEPNWSEPQPRQYPAMPPITLHAGSHITFSCDMTNETDSTITYGNSAETNEMCILHGMYWPRMTDPDGAEGCRGGSTKRESLDAPPPSQ